ncbi:MAG: hypothetical protein AAGK04_01940 [Planctomycetota bacterium]
MRSLIAILLAVCVAVQTWLPLQTCCCSDNPERATTTETEPSSRCCALAAATESTAPTPPVDKPAAPCDDCDCPLSCCTSVKAPITSPTQAAMVAMQTIAAAAPLTDRGAASPAHIDRLRRPPRTNAVA